MSEKSRPWLAVPGSLTDRDLAFLDVGVQQQSHQQEGTQIHSTGWVSKVRPCRREMALLTLEFVNVRKDKVWLRI